MSSFYVEHLSVTPGTNFFLSFPTKKYSYYAAITCYELNEHKEFVWHPCLMKHVWVTCDCLKPFIVVLSYTVWKVSKYGPEKTPYLDTFHTVTM